MRRLRLLGMVMALASATVVRPADGQMPKAIEIAPGESVQLVYQTIFERGAAVRIQGKRLDVQYTTSIPASDTEGRLAQADRAAEHFGVEAERIGARRLSIGICDTRACIERRDPPSEWHLYERKREGWRRIEPGKIR